jgi:large subunit ribosomal protein L15
MQLNQLQRKTENKTEKRVGRGGIRGKTSGRGTKGQNARAGHKKRPDIREKIKKLPKLRGYQFNSIETKPMVVNVATLEKMFAAGDTINPTVLIERGVLQVRKGTTPVVKVLGDGAITKKLIIAGCVVSASAKEKIEKAGGSIA